MTQKTDFAVADYPVVLLDMNATFMFGHDRLSPDEPFGEHFTALGGRLPMEQAHWLIMAVVEKLSRRFPDPAYHRCFPSLASAFDEVASFPLDDGDRERLVRTLSWFERGTITTDYVDAIQTLSRRHRLAVVADIWGPRDEWVAYFDRLGLTDAFSVLSFSSDHGVVKPSPEPFFWTLEQLGAEPANALMIGDSVRRDLGGALNAGVDCVLVGGACDARAVAHYPDLLALV